MALILGGLGLALIRADLLSVAYLNLPGPVFIPPHEPHPVTATPPHRVMTLLIDGLRADTVAKMPFLTALAAGGVHVDAWADLPTYSAAQYVSALSGVRPADSGVRCNIGLLRTPLDSVPRRVTDAGRVAVEIGDDVDWWHRLFGDDWTSAEVVSRGAVVGAVRERLVGADLLWVHLTETDTVGHELGAAAPEYLAAARRVDDQLRDLALAWGWPDNTIAVLADHGHHWPNGGHGGDELDVRRSFFIASGPGVRAGGHVSHAHLVDVGPTLAAILGVPAPAHAQGRTLIELVDAPLEARKALAHADVAREARVAQAVAAGRTGLARVERKEQALRASAVVICALLAIMVIRRARRAARLGLLVGTAALALTAAAYVAVFHRVSFSSARDAVPLALSTIRMGFIACGVTFALPIIEVGRGRITPSDAAAFSFLAVMGASPAALAAFIVCGAFSYRFTSDPAWVAAGPLIAYATLIPVALSGFTVAALAGLRALIVLPLAHSATGLPRRSAAPHSRVA